MSEEAALGRALDEVLAENPSLPQLSGAQREALVRHGDLLARWNRVHNLTRLEQPEDVARRHFADSLAGLMTVERRLPEIGQRVADVGSGAGFPGVVAALVWPNRNVVLVEAARKRASFLQQVARELRLGNLAVDNHRAEDVETGTFDLVLTRATLQWPELPQLGRLLSPGGWLVAWVADEPSETAWRQNLDGTELEDGDRADYEVAGLPAHRGIVLARRRQL